jgi:hypothetical protein
VSRGLGRVQWAVRDCLAAARPRAEVDGVVLLREIAEVVFGRPALDPVPREHIESVRRALMTLERLGMVELFYVVASGGTGWMVEKVAPGYEAPRRRQLAARLKRS